MTDKNHYCKKNIKTQHSPFTRSNFLKKILNKKSAVVNCITGPTVLCDLSNIFTSYFTKDFYLEAPSTKYFSMVASCSK